MADDARLFDALAITNDLLRRRNELKALYPGCYNRRVVEARTQLERMTGQPLMRGYELGRALSLAGDKVGASFALVAALELILAGVTD